MGQQVSSAVAEQKPTTVERIGDHGLIVRRLFDAPAEIVFRAWSQAELFQRWWFPKSLTGMSLVSCEMDVRTGGKYRLEFDFGEPDTMSFYGRYIDVVPNERMVWTNDEEEEGAITTVTFEEQGGKTLLTFKEVYPTAALLEEALQGSAAALPEQLEQLQALLNAQID